MTLESTYANLKWFSAIERDDTKQDLQTEPLKRSGWGMLTLKHVFKTRQWFMTVVRCISAFICQGAASDAICYHKINSMYV